MAKEENFKVCGLCSRLVDESAQLGFTLRAFLVGFLDVANADLPNKICTDCYQGALNCKKFREGCDRTMTKLRNTKLSENMILGRSAEDKKQIEATASKLSYLDNVKTTKGNKASRTATSNQPSGAKSRSKGSRTAMDTLQARVMANSESALLGPRATRNQRTGPQQSKEGGRQDTNTQPVISISYVERKLAEQALSTNGTIDYGKRKGGLVTPSRNGPPSDKRAKIESTYQSVSTFGRIRSKSKRGNVYTSVDEITSEDDDPPFNPRTPRAAPASSREIETSNGTPQSMSTSREKSPARARSMPQNKKINSKARPEKSKARTQQSKYYYVDEGGDQPDVVDVEEDENDEIFPSIGPYQCEICQVITSTKQEFVDHIKRFHRDVVDEDVLKSLENDLKKSKKKPALKTQKSTKKKISKVGVGSKNAAALAARKKRKSQEEKKRKKLESQKRKKAAAAKAKTVARRNAGKLSQPDRKQNEQSEQNGNATESADLAVLDTQMTVKEITGVKENTALDVEVHGLDGEVVEETEGGGDDSKNCQFWKTNVARKYEQESVKDEKLNNTLEEEHKIEPENENVREKQVTEEKEKEQQQLVGRTVSSEVQKTCEPPQIVEEQASVTQSFSAFHPIINDAGWVNTTEEVTDPHYQSAPMVQTYVPLTSTSFQIQQDSVNASSHYSIMPQSPMSVPVTNHQQIFVTDAPVQDNGQAVVVSGILQSSMPHVFY